MSMCQGRGPGVKTVRMFLETSLSFVASTLFLMILAKTELSLRSSETLMMGVLIFFVALMISLMRGTP